MKRVGIFLLLAVFLFAFLLTGCTGEREITVDPLTHTISDGAYTYTYTDAIVGDTRTIVITYPDSSRYKWEDRGVIGVGVAQSSSNGAQYTDGDVLVNAIVNPGVQPEKKEIMWPIVVIGVLSALIGLLVFLRPELVWNYTLRNIYDEEISNYAMYRLISGGIGVLVSGVGMILLGLRVFF